MFTYDERIKGLPVTREQVVSVHASLNSPHLAIPGKQAGPAQAYIVGLRGGSGLAVFVYLHLAETQDCAVYVPERRSVPPEALEAEELEAQQFVESMGFMMDSLNFGTLDLARQEELMKSLPPFLKDPRLAAARGKAEERKSATSALGRLLASF